MISQLFETEFFIRIGDRDFQIPRDAFSGPGDSPNFFTLGFGFFFASPHEVFPGLDRKGLLRPPSIAPPMVINRSADVFANLLHMLQGYPLHIQSEEHREELLRDCRYYHLLGLEQKLIAHNISYNIQRQKHEIVIRLEDVRQMGIKYVSDEPQIDSAISSGWVYYSRPFTDDSENELILEIGGQSAFIDLNCMRMDVYGTAKAKITGLFQVIANKLPTKSENKSKGLSGDRIKVSLDIDTDIVVDGLPRNFNFGESPIGQTLTETQRQRNDSNTAQNSYHQLSEGPPAKRKRHDSPNKAGAWTVNKGQWRLRIQPVQEPVGELRMEVVLVAVKLDAYSNTRVRNQKRRFL